MKIFKYMALALAAVVTMGCAKEIMEIDPNKVPSASELKVKIDVDQATNYVTFSIENQGMVPMWLFGEELIDGKANKKYAYTGNGISLRIRDAGTHSVEVKAYNAHGIFFFVSFRPSVFPRLLCFFEFLSLLSKI